MEYAFMTDFREYLNKHLKNTTGEKLLIDGAMGTQLQAKGMPSNVNPAEFVMSQPEAVKQIHIDYLKAGTNIILTSTFGGTRFKLPASAPWSVFDYNKKMAEIARSAIEDCRKNHTGLSSQLMFAAGDIGPTGLLLKPLGNAKPEDLFDAYKEQILGLAAGGVDLLFIETQFDIAEA